MAEQSPLAQLREFLTDRFVGSGELEGFVEEYFLELSPDIGWDGSLTNQVREFTTELSNHGLMDRLWPALKTARPGLDDEIDRLAGLDWSAKPKLATPIAGLDSRWLLGGGAAAVAVIVIAVVAFTGGNGGTSDTTTTTQATTTQATTTTAATTTTEGAPPGDELPQLEVTSIRAFNGTKLDEESAFELLVANRGDIAVNVDRATFTITRSGAVDCTLLPPTGGGPSFYARGAELSPESVRLYEYLISEDVGREPLKPQRRIDADGEETLIRFDVDDTREVPEDGTEPPYHDERYLTDDPQGSGFIEDVGYVMFEVAVTLETSGGVPFDAGTIVVAHPRLLNGLLDPDAIVDVCGWEPEGDVTLDGTDLYSQKLQENRAQIGQFCESPVVRDEIGANAQVDALLKAADLCE